MRADPPSPAITPAAGATTVPPRVWARYRDNLARHLIGIARDLENRSRGGLAERHGFTDLRPSFGPLLSLVTLEPRTLGTLAASLSITPQACSQLVDLCEGSGYVERRPDPTDGRARRLHLTERGEALVEAGIDVLREGDALYRERIGTAAYTRLTAAITDLFSRLGVPGSSEAGPVPRSPNSIGVLPLLSVHVQRELMQTTIARGHPHLKMSHAQVLPLIGHDGARIGTLARIQRVSRQAISATARELVDHGYLTREPDPSDRRGVVYRLTPSGAQLIEDSVASLDALEATLRDAIGARRTRGLEEAARSLYGALELESEVFGQSEAGRSDDALGRLAARLRVELGNRDAERLAALLEARA